MDERKQNSQKANRILYAVAVTVLCVLAVTVAIFAVANRADTGTPQASGTTATTAKNTSATQPGGQTPSQPTGGEETETEVYLCPISGSVSRRHDPENLIYSPTMGDWRTHSGIDITAKLGDTVKAVADGRVIEVREDVKMGVSVAIEHKNGVISIYRNLAPELAQGIAVGAQVKSGDAIGQVGESALCELADEAHLHFEMTQAGAEVDPLTLLDEASRAASLTFDEEVYED